MNKSIPVFKKYKEPEPVVVQGKVIKEKEFTPKGSNKSVYFYTLIVNTDKEDIYLDICLDFKINKQSVYEITGKYVVKSNKYMSDDGAERVSYSKRLYVAKTADGSFDKTAVKELK